MIFSINGIGGNQKMNIELAVNGYKHRYSRNASSLHINNIDCDLKISDGINTYEKKASFGLEGWHNIASRLILVLNKTENGFIEQFIEEPEVMLSVTRINDCFVVQFCFYLWIDKDNLQTKSIVLTMDEEELFDFYTKIKNSITEYPTRAVEDNNNLHNNAHSISFFSSDEDNQEVRYVQSFINNISFPKTLDELEYVIYERGGYYVQDILAEWRTSWTVPNWAKIGDVVFFMHSKTADATISKLRKELKSRVSEYEKTKYNRMLEWLDIASKLHQKYGGKIFAVGEVIESSYYAPTEQEDTDLIHWRSSIYADIRFQVLQKPIDISEFNDFITVSRRGAITPVFGDAFLRLKNIIREKNFTLDYLNKSQSVPVPLSEIDSSNWLELTSKYRRSFLLESQFRTFYVDYLLNEINETDMLYRECRCCKDSIHDSFVDNVIYIDKKYLPVEIKLSVENIGEEAITKQVNKYCNNTKIYLNSKKIIYPEQIHKSVLIIDTTYVYIYSAEQKTIRKIYTLDRLYDTNDLLLKLKGILQDRIEESIENPDFIPASVREIAKQL